MSLEQCTFSQDMAADCLQTSSLGTSQLSLLNGTPTPAKSYENGRKTDGGQDCKCGKETFDCSIHPSTPESWIAFMRDSLAQICQQPAFKQELALRHEVACTVKSSASLAWYDQNSSTWKTSQQSLITDSEPYSQTLPASGMLANGRLYELPTVGRLTKGTDGGAFFATPTCTSNQLAPSMMKHKSCKALHQAIYPTPTSHDAKKGAYPSEYNRNTPGIAVILGGRPSPMFQEWQMGWPIQHSALKESETGKSRCKPPQLGESSEARDAN
jgi:hypothetical protein